MGLRSQGPDTELRGLIHDPSWPAPPTDISTALAQQPRWRHRHHLGQSLVIDIYVRVSLVGIELLTVDARIVIASVDTSLRFAEAVN